MARAITVRGTSFTSTNMTLRIGGVAATSVVSTDPTTLTAVTPAGTAGARDILITNGWGLSVTLTGGFTYTRRPNTPIITRSPRPRVRSRAAR